MEPVQLRVSKKPSVKLRGKDFLGKTRREDLLQGHKRQGWKRGNRRK